jgi:hypothetical protein
MVPPHGRLTVPAPLPRGMTPHGRRDSGEFGLCVTFTVRYLDMNDQPSTRGPCAWCDAPISETAEKTTIQGTIYHACCWDRKARSEAKK